MRLSYEPGFIFIHVDKAAGSSIQIALQPYARRPKDSRLRRRLTWLGTLNRLGLYRVLEFPEHATARTVKRCLPPEMFGRFFKFAFVRNPWDRLVSRHAYLLRSEDHPRHKLVSRMKSFEEYVGWEIRRGKMLQRDYVTDAHGRWIVDYVGYYERLHEDFAKVCARLGVRAELPRANPSAHKDYRSYYPPSLRDQVAEAFRADIELFGYEFDGLPAASRPRELAGKI